MRFLTLKNTGLTYNGLVIWGLQGYTCNRDMEGGESDINSTASSDYSRLKRNEGKAVPVLN
jgi:hypothetical protein